MVGQDPTTYDLALTKNLISAGPFSAGDIVTYQIVVENQGNLDASNVVVSDNSPAGLLYMNSTTNANVVDNGNETFTILNLAIGTSQVIEVFYQIDANFTGSSLTNTAEITSDDGDDIDSDPNTDATVCLLYTSDAADE